MLARVRAGLIAVPLDSQLVDELLNAYQEIKRNFYLGGLRLSAVEGGRFAEAAFRLLGQRAFGTYVALGKKLDTEAVARKLANVGVGTQPDSIRLHIPRALRVITDIRNNRDAAHLGDGIDPNFQDASLVVAVSSWVMAEFVRLHHNIPADEAQDIVERLVARTVPAIQEFDGHLKLLRASLRASEALLVLLFQCGPTGATYEQLSSWVKPSMRANLKRTLRGLVDDLALVHESKKCFKITRAGEKEVEQQRLIETE